MSKICYVPHDFRGATLNLVDKIDTIVSDMHRQGYSMTLRQIYYSLVSEDAIPNDMKSYKRIGEIINAARLSGDLDWSHIEDRARNLADVWHNSDGGEIIRQAANAYSLSKWADQEHYVEVWIEKEALSGIIARPAEALDCPYFACKGYVSQSEMWGAAMRLLEKAEDGKTPVIIHLGDHDPSGLDMTRDIRERIGLFLGINKDECDEDYGHTYDENGTRVEVPEAAYEFKVVRLALNMDQIKQYRPPPNFAKSTDSRFAEYQKRFGTDSWELDALAKDPKVIDDMVRAEIRKYINVPTWNATIRREKKESDKLRDFLNDAAVRFEELE